MISLLSFLHKDCGKRLRVARCRDYWCIMCHTGTGTSHTFLSEKDPNEQSPPPPSISILQSRLEGLVLRYTLGVYFLFPVADTTIELKKINP